MTVVGMTAGTTASSASVVPVITPSPPPSTAVSVAGGGAPGSAGDGSEPAPTGPYLQDGSGHIVSVAAGDAIPVPPGLSGQVSLLSPDMVPSTVLLPTGGSLVLHPSSVWQSPPPGQQATIQGSLSTATANITVQYVSPGRTLFAGGLTDAAGHFSFSVPIAAQESGLIIARDSQAIPDVAVDRVAKLSPGMAYSVPTALTLAAPTSLAGPGLYKVLYNGTTDPSASGVTVVADTSGIPPLPTVTSYTPDAGGSFPQLQLGVADTEVQLVEGPSGSTWRAMLAAFNSAVLPVYSLPGYVPVFSVLARSSDGAFWSEISGPQGHHLPSFLQPPELSGVGPQLGSNGAIAWSVVPGASLYTLKITLPGMASTPAWEGATTGTSLTLPAHLGIPDGQVTLELDAWDAPDVTLYSVADLRALRVPTEPQGTQGRHSWSLRNFTFQN